MPAPIVTSDKTVYKPGETIKITAKTTPRVLTGTVTDQDGKTSTITIIVSSAVLTGITATAGADTGDATTRTTVFTGIA